MSEEEKKDLTNIIDFARLQRELHPEKEEPHTGAVPPTPERNLDEKLEHFDSFDEYVKNNPFAEPPPEPDPFHIPEAASPHLEASHSAEHELASSNPIPGFESSSDDFNSDSSNDLSDIPGLSGMSEGAGYDPNLDPTENPYDHSSVDYIEEATRFSIRREEEQASGFTGSGIPGLDSGEPTDYPVNIPGITPEPPAPVEAKPPSPVQKKPVEATQATTPVTPQVPAPAPKFEDIKKAAAKTSAAKPLVPAAYPFSLMIEGQLAPEEQEKLLDVLEKENFGITAKDLEPQFAAGKILIPRISEFAGVILIQALRSIQASMRLGPSDQIFSTPDTEEDDLTVAPDQPPSVKLDAKPNFRIAENLPILSTSHLPGNKPYEVLDTLIASATLRSDVVEAENSAPYLALVENLKNEIRYKAFRKGASHLTSFQIQLTQLSSPTLYRVSATGIAVKETP